MVFMHVLKIAMVIQDIRKRIRLHRNKPGEVNVFKVTKCGSPLF